MLPMMTAFVAAISATVCLVAARNLNSNERNHAESRNLFESINIQEDGPVIKSGPVTDEVNFTSRPRIITSSANLIRPQPSPTHSEIGMLVDAASAIIPTQILASGGGSVSATSPDFSSIFEISVNHPPSSSNFAPSVLDPIKYLSSGIPPQSSANTRTTSGRSAKISAATSVATTTDDATSVDAQTSENSAATPATSRNSATGTTTRGIFTLMPIISSVPNFHTSLMTSTYATETPTSLPSVFLSTETIGHMTKTTDSHTDTRNGLSTTAFTGFGDDRTKGTDTDRISLVITGAATMPATSDLPSTYRNESGNILNLIPSILPSPSSKLSVISATNSATTPNTNTEVNFSTVVTSTETGSTRVTTASTSATGSGTPKLLPIYISTEPSKQNITDTLATSTTALSTDIPKVIVRPDGVKPIPEGSLGIQLGFKYPLNYTYVSGNSTAAAQIFRLLPIALADASGIDVRMLQIQKLVPFDTRNASGYITTLAKLHYPKDRLESLRAGISAPHSKLYHNPSETINSLTALIDPTIDVLSNNDNQDVKNNGSGKNDIDGFGASGDARQSSKQMATTAGIVMGAVSFGAMCGACMFVTSRRYKRKRLRYPRSDSLSIMDMKADSSDSSDLIDAALLYTNSNCEAYGAKNGKNSAHNAHI